MNEKISKMADSRESKFSHQEELSAEEKIQKLEDELSLEKENSKKKDARNIELEEELKKRDGKEEILNNKIVEVTMLFSLMAHDLRSPFQGIIGMTESCIEDVKVNEIKFLGKDLQVVLDSALSTLELLDDLLAWGKLNIDSKKPEIEPFNLFNKIDNTLDLLKSTYMNKGIIVKNEIDNDLIVSSNINMVTGIIRNFISNAIKFTNKDGEINIYSEASKDKIIIYVKDNGVGIAKDKIEKLLEKIGYTTKGTNGEQGTGLGLSLCSKMANKIDGKIEVESGGEGKGTTFILTLPTVEKTS